MTATQGSDAYAQWVEEWEQRGFEAYIITFMFEQIEGSSEGIQRQMLKIVQQVYATYLTRIVKRPLSPSARDLLPIWIVAPDLPVYKRNKQSLRDVTVNQGLHVQGIDLEPQARKAPELIDEQFFNRRRLYRQRCPELESIHLRRITHDIERVTDYVFKHVHRGTISEDNVLVLPRTVPEMRCSPNPRIGRQASIFG